MSLKFCILSLLGICCANLLSLAQTTVCFNLQSESEQIISTGLVDVTSSDIELGFNGGAQIVGLRYTAVSLPATAVVLNSSLQFVADEPSIGSSDLKIYGELVGNAAALTSANFDLSSRAKTNNFTNWSVNPWLAYGNSGLDQKSPDISNVLNEIISNPSYNSGNALAFLIEGTGTRVAVNSPIELCVTYKNCLNNGGDTDGDGICDDIDVCPNSSLNLDIDNDGNCDSGLCSTVSASNFDLGLEDWNTSGFAGYSFVNTNPTYSNSGSNSFGMFYNIPTYSSILSKSFDLSNKSEIAFEFSYLTQGYGNGESFFIDISVDAGVNFTSLKEYVKGTDFSLNDTYYTESFPAAGPFSANTVFRIRGNGFSYLYIDDIKFSACDDCTGQMDSDGDGICDAYDSCPNSPTNDADNDGICDDLDVCFPGNDLVDNDNDGIPDDCDPCVDVNSNGICDDVDQSLPKMITINEINYRSVAYQKNIDFIEIYNHGNTSIDISNWKLSDGVSYTFPSGTTIAVDEYIVIAADPATCEAEFGFSGALGPFTGNLSSKGEEIVLRDDNFKTVDQLKYKAWEEWPNVRFNDFESNGIKTKIANSLQKTNPEIDSSFPGAWKANSPTPKAKNNAVYLTNLGLNPILKKVDRFPASPLSGDAVEVKAIYKYTANSSLSLQYQVCAPGAYIAKSNFSYANNWITIPMLDNGLQSDSIANDGEFSAVIPANNQVHRNLVRYRLKITNGSGVERYVPDPNHEESNFAYYVYDAPADYNGYSFSNLPAMQNVTILTNQAIPTYNNDIYYEASLVYNGEVYDHIRIKGRGSKVRTKPGIKVDLNAEKKIITLNDCGEEYDVAKSKLILSGTWVNDSGSHGLVESLCYKILDLVGGLAKHNDYTSLRVVDDAAESGANGDFWGIYLIQEDFGGDMWEEHNLGDGNLWEHKPLELKYLGDYPGSQTQGQWDQSFVNIDTAYFIGDYIANEFWANGEANYIGKHSFKEYFNPLTGKWHAWCADYDGAFGSGNNVVNVSTIAGDPSAIVTQGMPVPASMTIQYKNELRSAYDLLLNQQQSNFLVENEYEKVYAQTALYDWTDLDKARWPAIYYFTGNVDAQMSWYKTWFQDRANFLNANSIYGFSDVNIPNRPSISNVGSTAIDDLNFVSSGFNDPQGNATFAAMQWRVGEWSDPTNPFYDGICEAIYEIEEKWISQEITTNNPSYSIPAAAQLEAGRSYKVRLRYKDNTGRWGHWSTAYSFVANQASSNSNQALVINEIMYNPAFECGTEFIELYNPTNSSLSLANIKFTEGVDYAFPKAATIPANGYIIIAKDSLEFLQLYGSSPFGEYSGKLSNSGERIVLKGNYDTIIDSLSYSDSGDWESSADQGFMSLALMNPALDNSNPDNWDIQTTPTTPRAANFFDTSHEQCGLVINEIHYHPLDSINPSFGFIIPDDYFEFIELKNASNQAINLANAFFSKGIEFQFPEWAIIQPGEFIVLANDSSLFVSKYGTSPFGQYSGKLSNSGEVIAIHNGSGLLLDWLEFDDASPWDTNADGQGASLALIDCAADNSNANNWMVQAVEASPGTENDFDPCRQENFLAAPTGLNEFIDWNAGTVTLSWDAYPNAKACLIRAWYANLPAYKTTIFVGNLNGSEPPTGRSFAITAIPFGVNFQWDVVCGCNVDPLVASPFSTPRDFIIMTSPP